MEAQTAISITIGLLIAIPIGAVAFVQGVVPSKTTAIAKPPVVVEKTEAKPPVVVEKTEAKPPVVMEKTEAEKEEDAKRNSLSLAAKNVVFVQFCEREYFSMTPLERDAIEFFVTNVAAKYGKAAVKEAAAESYRDGYYSLDDKWCSIMRNAVHSMADAMRGR